MLKMKLDNTVNGTVIYREDPVKQKLKRLADEKIMEQVQTPELIIQKMSDRVVVTDNNKKKEVTNKK